MPLYLSERHLVVFFKDTRPVPKGQLLFDSMLGSTTPEPVTHNALFLFFKEKNKTQLYWAYCCLGVMVWGSGNPNEIICSLGLLSFPIRLPKI